MLFLVVGLVMWIGVHCVPLKVDLRADFLEKYGERTYKGLFSLISAVGLGLIIWGKSQAEFIEVWQPYAWGRVAAMMLMFPALILLVASNGPDNGFRRILGHPMILAVELWAIAHLMANGDVASILLFGAFLAWSIVAFTSNLRRKPPVGGRGKWRYNLVVIVIAIALYIAILHGHEWLAGVRLLP